MPKNDSFSALHPVLGFTFFIGAITMGMLFQHPLFLVCNGLFALTYAMTLHVRKAGKRLLGLVPLAVGITLVNPLLNSAGETVLLTVLGRNYTLEAMLWGFVTGSMFCVIFLWFFSYNIVMTSDKFLFLFGRMMPAICLVLTMILRLIPSYQRKVRQIASARACIGRESGNREEAMAVLSALTSWALENGIITADSMRCRGFGTAKRTAFSCYRFTARDLCLLLWMGFTLAVTVLCAMRGGMKASFLPTLQIAWGRETQIGVVFYSLFLMIPTILNITEDIKWHILRSGI